jgi:sigma-E factor negative regulatory protein RseA
MTEQNTHHPLAESLSALVDNQASELELQRILKASESDAEVSATWSRYQVAGAVMRGDMPAFAISDFASRVSAAIEAEEAHRVVPAETKATHWWQNMARFAVAASVAGGVILFSQNYSGISDSNVQVASGMAETPVVAPAASIPSGYHGQALSLRTVGMQNGYEARQPDNRQVIFVPRQITGGERALATDATTSDVESVEDVRDYLFKLIEAHADNAALNSSQGMLPFARVVLTEED